MMHMDGNGRPLYPFWQKALSQQATRGENIAFAIFVMDRYEWGNTEGYPVEGNQIPAFHRCGDGYPSSDVRVSAGEFVYCARCDKKFPGVQSNPGNDPSDEEIRQLQIEDAATDWMRDRAKEK